MTAQSQETVRLQGSLPAARGRYLMNTPLARYSWLRVGGNADILFLPSDAADLAAVLAALPGDIPVATIGVGSNLLVRDGGVRGMVVRLGRSFANIRLEPGHRIRAGAGTLDSVIAQAALNAEIGGLEFLDGIPGTLGGALRMNAGSHGSEIADVFVEASILDRQGRHRVVDAGDMAFSYRRCGLGEEIVFIEALLQGRASSREKIETRLEELRRERTNSQPIRAFTGGSTFKNPPGKRKAWQLIAAAGCRDMRRGDAMLSPRHCNFLVNAGNASAADLESLVEDVRGRVKAETGVSLEWEVVRIGEEKRPIS